MMLQKFLLHKERKGFEGPQRLRHIHGNHKIRTDNQNCHLFFWKLTVNPTWKLFCTSRKTTNLQSRHRDWSANLIDNPNNPVELLYTVTRYSRRSTHPATTIVFFPQNLLGRWVGDNLQEDIANFSHRSERKVQRFRNRVIFWRSTTT